MMQLPFFRILRRNNLPFPRAGRPHSLSACHLYSTWNLKLKKVRN